MEKQSRNSESHGRVIAHVDMDCFFVAVERLKDPSLVGKPVVVGGDPAGRGVISSASYEAREYGVHSAMPASQAKRLCPQAIFLKGSFEDYDHYSRQVRRILEEYTPLVEMASIDEAYLDLTGTERLFGPPEESAERIKEHIREETGLIASFGVASNKLVAKIASDYGKPDGMTIIAPGSEPEFLAPMDIRTLPGIGPSMEQRLRSLEINTAGDLAGYNIAKLAERLGDQALARGLHERATGQSDSPVVPERERKSISKEMTFREDVTDVDYLRAILHYLSDQVTLKLRTLGMRASTITCKYRYPDFETHTRSQSLEVSTDFGSVVYNTAEPLLTASMDPTRGIRLIGVGVSNLQSANRQTELFADDSFQSAQDEKRESAVDQVRKKFGFESILAGQSIRLLNTGNTRKRGEDTS